MALASPEEDFVISSILLKTEDRHVVATKDEIHGDVDLHKHVVDRRAEQACWRKVLHGLSSSAATTPLNQLEVFIRKDLVVRVEGGVLRVAHDLL